MNTLDAVTFPTFRVGVDSVEAIGAMPDGKGGFGLGVAEEMRRVFNYEGDYGGLIGAMAPHRELQKDIAFIQETLANPDVRARIGQSDKTPVEVARGWVLRTGLLTKVFRPFMQPVSDPAELEGLEFEAAELPDRVPNWLERMGDVAIEVGRAHKIGILALPSSDREIGPDEKPDVTAGTPAASYMEQTLKPRLEQGRTRAEIAADNDETQPVFGSVEMIKTGEKNGDEVMVAAARKLKRMGIELVTAKILVLAVAGNWPQTGAQARNGLQTVEPNFDRDPNNRQLIVACDNFLLGETGEEPKATHQNPFSGSANIPRAFKLFDEISA